MKVIQGYPLFIHDQETGIFCLKSDKLFGSLLKVNKARFISALIPGDICKKQMKIILYY